MKTFIQILNEAKDDTKLLQVDDMLWFTYGPNSGITTKLSSKTYLTDKKGDSNYDPTTVSKFAKFAKNQKPLKAKNNLKLYPIPIYSDNDAIDYDIWGGKNKPIKTKFAIVSSGKINVVTFFDSKSEALAWIKTSI